MPTSQPENAIITPSVQSTPVPESVQRMVREYKLATGKDPEIAPRPSTPDEPRAHLPKFHGKMRGELPDDHPARLRQVREQRRRMARERERDKATLRREAAVDQKIRVGTRVEIGSNAKVDFEESDGTRITGNYAGIEGEVFQTYVDKEGVRRHIIIDRDPATGRSRYAPVSVRECDLKVLDRTNERYVSLKSAAARAQEQAERRAALATMSQEDIERSVYGGLTAKELADKMCGLS